DVVPPEIGIGGDDGETLALRLSDQHAVERVTMAARKPTHGFGVGKLHEQRLEAVAAQLVGDRDAARNLQSSAARLDRNLPCRRNAKADLGGLQNDLAGLGPQALTALE